MPIAPSFTDLLGQFEAEALSQRPTLKFRDGDISEAQAHGAGAMADAAIRFTSQSFKDTFIDGAEGDALTALVDDHLNLQRQGATPAQSTITLTRTSAGPGGTYPAGSVVGTVFDASGNTVLFTLDADATFPNASNGPISANVTAQIAGRGGNASAGTITRLVTVPFDSTISITNPADAGGGNEVETDHELRVRARNFWVTLRRGTIAALEFGALSVASVRIAKAFEDAISGIVTLVVSDSDGNSTVQMIGDVTTEIENWRAAGCIVTIVGGAPLIVNITGTPVYIDGIDRLVMNPLVVTAITERMRKLRQGELLYLDTIKAAGIGVDPDIIEAIPLSTPTNTITPLSYQVIRPGVITMA